MRADIQAHITWLERRLARPTADLAAAIRSSPRWRAQDEIVQRMPGVGPVLARTLVAAVPALGRWNRQESAALIGMAPFNGLVKLLTLLLNPYSLWHNRPGDDPAMHPRIRRSRGS
jgi:hypothetical protein